MNFEVCLKSVQSWDNGGNGSIIIKNLGESVTDWKFQLTTQNFVISEFWNLIKEGTGKNIYIKPASWKTTIAKNETIESGFSYTGIFDNNITTSTLGINIINTTTTNINTNTNTNTNIDQNYSTGNTTNIIALTNKTKKVFGYFTEWSIYDRQYSVDMIPDKQLTHIIYAFMLPNPSQDDYNLLAKNYPFPPKPYYPPPQIAEGTLVFHDEYAGKSNIDKLKVLKNKNPNIKILISVGGWTLSWTLSKICANVTLRNTFVKSAVDFIIKNGFDGIDIDWEYPGKQGIGFNYIDPINDPINFLQLIRDLRNEFSKRSTGKYYEITAAVGTSPEVIKNYKDIHPELDYLLLMTYDYAGSWGDGGHLAGLYWNKNGTMDPQFNVDSAVSNMINIGCPVNKLCLGCPIYARGWAKIVPINPNLPIYGKSIGGPAISYSGRAGEPGLTSWRHLRDVINKNNLIRYYDDISHAVFIHNSNTGETWTYDDPNTIIEKTKYLINKNIAGIMFWELSDDTRDGIDNLVTSAVITLNQNSNQNSINDTTISTETTITNGTSTTSTTNGIINGTTENKKLLITIKNIGTSNFVLQSGETINIYY